MITINLLPAELRPIKRTPIPYILSVVLVAVAFAMCFQLHMGNVVVLADLKEVLQNDEAELASLKGSVDQYNQLMQEKKLLAAQLETINEIASDRIIWSEQLYHLTRLALPNMWYSNMKVTKKSTSITRTEIDKSGKPKNIKTTVVNQVLTLEGYVSPDSSGRTSLSPFTTATKNDEEFSARFQLEDWDYVDTTFENTSVKKFLLQYIVIQGGVK
jgi:hypothetical protein